MIKEDKWGSVVLWQEQIGSSSVTVGCWCKT